MPDKPWNEEPYVTQERIRITHYGIGAIGAVGLLSMRGLPVVPYLRPRLQPREESE